MRAWTLLLGFILLSPALAGCIGTDDGETTEANSMEPGAVPLSLEHIPPGAVVNETAEGLQLIFESIELPLNQDFEVPEGTTMVRATTELGNDASPFVRLTHAETDRRRCNVPYYQAWEQPTTGTMSCAGLTAVDVLPTNWTVSAAGASTDATVTIDLISLPIDGPASQLDLSQLSMPTHDLLETEPVEITTHDGETLYAELTRPDVEEPLPVILASSPYNAGDHLAGQPAMWSYFVKDWAMRGYAVVVADVRGTGYSGGCMEVWGPNEAQDQVVLVDWAAEQPWSDGNIGFYGQSYVGTTPVEAAIENPEALKAIIAVAPVNNAYDDWHFGGVPNGEQALSPGVAYQVGVGVQSKLDESDPVTSALTAANGVCDPTLTARANDPRAIYDAFYEERNFTTGASGVQAAVMYTQGFEDTNVKSQMATHWFNPLPGPKLGVFGHWVHQHPVRADSEVLMLAWMDQYVKGKALGLEALDPVLVTTNTDQQRTAETWPPADVSKRTLYPNFGDEALEPTPSDTSGSILLDPTGDLSQVPATTTRTLEASIQEPFSLAGQAKIALSATLQGADNAHVAAFLYDVGDGERRVVTFGMANLAHRNGHDQYSPVPPGETIRAQLPFLPTEHVFEANHTLELVIRGAQNSDWALVTPTKPGTLTIWGGEQGTELLLPTIPMEDYTPRPMTSQT